MNVRYYSSLIKCMVNFLNKIILLYFKNIKIKLERTVLLKLYLQDNNAKKHI